MRESIIKGAVPKGTGKISDARPAILRNTSVLDETTRLPDFTLFPPELQLLQATGFPWSRARRECMIHPPEK